jgi:HEAT repeat protein
MTEEPTLDPVSQSRAIMALGGMDRTNNEVVQALESFVSRDDLDRCRQAVEALAQLGPGASEAVPAIAKLFDEGSSDDLTDGFFRAAVATALGKFGAAGAAAIPALRKELSISWGEVRSSAARALGLMGSAAKECVPELSRLVDDRDKTVRAAAAEALGRIHLH